MHPTKKSVFSPRGSAGVATLNFEEHCQDCSYQHPAILIVESYPGKLLNFPTRQASACPRNLWPTFAPVLEGHVLSAPKSQRFLRFAIAIPIADPRNRAISGTRKSNAALRFKSARWKVASDLRFRAAISEPETVSESESEAKSGNLNLFLRILPSFP